MAPGSAGACLGQVGMALHHKLCHTLGGSFNLPHAETHTVVLPHAARYNRAAAPEAMARAARALGAPDARRGACTTWLVRLGAPLALKQIGMPADGLDQAARARTQNPYCNPRPLDYGGHTATLAGRMGGQTPGLTTISR